MVTSNKLPDKKVVKMTEQKNSVVVPQRTLLGEVNEHITCPLCSGYYIDATTIVECLHSFCRSCIIKHLQVKSYCPVCEMMINSAKPNIKLDKALQDIVYKLVPGLFQREMERRQLFYASRPGPAATATPEQRGEDTERIIFSPEDVISFSLEYADVTDADSISSKSSDSNESQGVTTTTRRYLQCPAVVNISHLKKFLSMKFDIDSTQFAIDILYKRVPLPDYYTLMDIAYIYNWKRNEPMRFFYQIIDYVAIRNRLFDINRKETHFGDRKSSPTSTEDTNVSSPAPNLHDHGSEASSGTNSPMPDDNNTKHVSDTSKCGTDKSGQQSKDQNHDNISLIKNTGTSSSKKNDDDEEKSQFLNSFELTAKNNCTNIKTSPVKLNASQDVNASELTGVSASSCSPKVEDNLKRKYQTSVNIPEMKKLRVEIEKTKIPSLTNSPHVVPVPQSHQSSRSSETSSMKNKNVEGSSNNSVSVPTSKTLSSIAPIKDLKKDTKSSLPMTKPITTESVGVKRNITGSQNTISSPKRKAQGDISTSSQPPQSPSSAPKTVSPLKIQVPRSDPISTSNKATDVSTTSIPTVKKIPDLKPSSMASPAFSNKQPVNKVRMDLLANNSDIDRSKVMPPGKSPLNTPNVTNSGDPLKSLFDSCKINIPSSLSITLTDQKLESRNPTDAVNVEQIKNVLNKNLSGASTTSAHKVPSPPVHNYIQILKIPESDPKKNNKPENNPETKLNSANKSESSSPTSKPLNKSSETSTKGPIPNLKPIADTKLGKQGSNFTSPITFQQTFEQQLQSLQSDKKSKVSKNKAQVPKLVPATPKALSAVNKPSATNNKSSPSSTTAPEPKTSSALDLSTSNNIQNQSGPQQTFDKAFETMQSIANLAKKQNLQSKGLQIPMSQNNIFSSISNRPQTSGIGQLRIPSTSAMSQIKPDKVISNSLHSTRQEVLNKNSTLKSVSNVSSTVPSPSYPITSHSSPNTQPSPRSQTRSPSSSPKLVIAEEKQVGNSSSELSVSQPNQMLNTQLSNMSNKSESPKVPPGPSKSGIKPVKPLTPTSKMPIMRQSQTPAMKPNPMLNSSDYQALLRHQFEMNNWFKVQHRVHYDMYKNSMTQQTKNDFSDKDKQ